MTSRFGILFSGLLVMTAELVFGQSGRVQGPREIEAGSAFSIPTTGSGKAALYILGPGQVLRRDIQLGETVRFAAGALYNAGHYLVVISGDSSTVSDSLDVMPGSRVTDLGFLAKPSRLQVGQRGGISGAVFAFDGYQNLYLNPAKVSFELSGPSGGLQKRELATREGSAWTEMDSTTRQGVAIFVARIGGVSSKRIIGQVPGDPCGLRMSARPLSEHVQLVTDPVRDCSGNAVPDGTIVTFTETHNGVTSTIDQPIKHGTAMAQMSATNGATFSVASGVVLGNQIRWGR